MAESFAENYIAAGSSLNKRSLSIILYHRNTAQQCPILFDDIEIYYPISRDNLLSVYTLPC